MAQKKLYRSKTKRMVAGVCGGLSDYLNVDVTIVRLGFIFFTFVWGIALPVYIVMWVLVPENSKA